MKAVSCLLFALVLAGCQYDPHTTEYTATQSSPIPHTVDLVGTYSPTQDTRDLIANTGHYRSVSISITLSRDGTFRFKNVPDWWNTDGGEPHGTFSTSGGRWSVTKHQDWWALRLDFTRGYFSSEMMLVGQKPPYLLNLTVGDPDAGTAMQFERQK